MLSPVLAALAAFTLAAILLSITPGLDTALIVRTSASEGRRAGVAAAMGTAVGCLWWASLTALGLGALLAASTFAYEVLKWIGAAYLMWLGIRMLLNPRTAFNDTAAPERGRRGAFGWLVKGFLTNTLNPQVGVFYVSFLPQFVPHGVAVPPFILLLGVVHAVIGFAWLAILTGATHHITTALKRPGVLKWLDRVTGVVFLAFGARLALESRR